MAQTLQLSFVNQAGNRSSISLDNPRTDITQSEVVAAMDLIIANNIFNTNGGDLTAKYSAQVVDREVSVIYGQ